MIARTHRFHGHGSIRYVYSRGAVVRGPLCVLKYTSNPRRKTWRAAVVVSRKVHKSAVARNRIRRRLYEITRLHLPKDGLPIDFVFIVHSAQIATIPAPELERLIVAQLRKAGIVEVKGA